MKKPLSKKKKILIAVLTPISAALLAFAVLCIVTASMYSSAFLGRVLIHWDSSFTDYEIFPERVIRKSDSPYSYEIELDTKIAELAVNGADKQQSINEFIKSTDTVSFIIVKNDKIVYEQYADGYDEKSINTSFSMAKSVISLLIGRAIENGHIKSVSEPISNYIKEFENREIGKTTIEELLLMRSAIAYDEDKFLWFGDDSLTYWHDDLRALALSHTELNDEHGGGFWYNNYHPLLLGIILERSTGVSVSEFFEREVWRKIGAEYDASWSLDSDRSGFEKMESGINFRPRDFIKIGSAVLHDGFFNGMRIFDSGWIKRSTVCDFPIDDGEYRDTFLSGKNIGYKYMWYGTPSENSIDIAAWGKSDQIMYISPENNTVILRTGFSDGGVSNWMEILKTVSASV